MINDPNAEVRTVNGFHAIDVSNAIDLYLSQGDQETVAVSARETKWRDRIRTEVVDGVLKIYLERASWGLDFGNGNKHLKAYVSFKALDKLYASGASDVFVQGAIAVPSLSLHLSGASDFKGAIKVGSLNIEQAGASDAHISGAVAGLTSITCSGASDVKAYELVTDSCEVHASGASDIRITVTKLIVRAHASGASDFYYKGDAVIQEMHSSGASSISKK